MTQNRTSEPMAMLFLGLLVGAAGALLYAPRSGRETREKMLEKSKELQDQTMAAKDKLVDKMKTGLDKVSTEVSDKADQAAAKMDSVKGRGRGKQSEFNRATPYTDETEEIV